MSKLADSLRETRICNNWGMLDRFGTKQDVVVAYHAFIPGRIGIGSYSHTEVWSSRPHPKLPERATMGVTYQRNFRGKRVDSLPEALAWVAAELECGRMVPSPFGGYLPHTVVQKAKESLECPTKTSSTT